MSESETPQERPEDEPAAEATEEQDGPDAAELDKDPAYNPEDEHLKDLKGG